MGQVAIVKWNFKQQRQKMMLTDGMVMIGMENNLEMFA